MNKTSLIGHVVELHAVVVASRHPADNEVRSFLRSRQYLGSRDRRFITETLYSMIRHHRLIHGRVRLASRLFDPSGFPDSSLILYAAYAVGVASEPEQRVCTDIAPLYGSAFPDLKCEALVAALASADPLADETLTPETRTALASSLPPFLVHEWYERYGGEAGDLCRALNQSAPTTARVNTLRCTVDQCIEQLRREGVAAVRTRLSPAGIVFGKRVNLPSLDSFRRGFFEMQDEGSQLVSLLAEPSAGGVVVDACAGGGGKTLHLAALMENRGTLLAVEANARRLGDIRERIKRSGASIMQVVQADGVRDIPESWMGKADVVLVDAPCSGTGALRRNPGARLHLTEAVVDAAAEVQRVVLSDYSALVRPGGRLVYSTCSLLRKENEDIVEEFLAARPEFALLPAGDILRKQGVSLEFDSPLMTLLPHKTGTDGFFGAVLTRLR